ncbi:MULTISPECIES: hypothetical protein [Cyanophyceae]|uniref:hypothetical protein n=1 Tax=Cyanophyceae TaxID=3028117 RepID=UPI00232E0E47|nr:MULTISPECIES: hypothetical protein [Cyanophyceae]MDB9357290.1 hypothetical protein [Nodularia spumigena CS-587/03]MDB9319795.1 hypothetical protein [Nodularia spumigena CS-590/01A]MDB9322074.1 hypothetical protein [Nodularia spumigena CS-591/07A]MDB9327676.1 hypothetical protein [Nodularia spumigena CS-590/02]MDB9331099.1 hypothetical protein [Nodularia spumigena CS-591/04]
MRTQGKPRSQADIVIAATAKIHSIAQIIATHNVKYFQIAELLFPNLSILKPETVIRS